MQKSLVSAVITAGCLVSTTGFSWGQKAHQLVNKVAISMVNNPEAQRFLQANEKQVVSFASTPDVSWKSGPNAHLEKPLHWFEIDGYQESMGEAVADLIFGDANAQLGADVTTKYGRAMWRTSSLYGKLVEALKNKQWTQALQIAGVMGHYIGDMTQPMHATTDYDGQSIDKPGIHKYYETTLVDRINQQHLFDQVLVFAGERRSNLERSIGNDLSHTELQRVTYTEAETGFAAMDQILGQFSSDDQDDEWLKKDLTPRVARAAALLGKVWDVAFTASGARNMPSQNLNTQVPAWIAMD